MLRRPPSPATLPAAVASTIDGLRQEVLHAPQAGGQHLTDIFAGTVLADDVAQQVKSIPWRSRTGALWFDVLATITETAGQLHLAIQSGLISESADIMTGGVGFQPGVALGSSGGSWATVDVLCYVGSTLIDTVALTPSTTTKRVLLKTPIPPNGTMSFVVKVDSSTTLVADGEEVAAFSMPGFVSDVESGRFYVRRAGPIGLWRASVDPRGSTSSVISLRKNGVEQDTITLTSSDYTDTEDPAFSVSAGDYLTVKATTVGTGVGNLVVQVYR